MSNPFIPDDLLNCAVPTECAISPDESRLLFTLLTQDGAKDMKVSALWQLDLTKLQATPFQCTVGISRDSQPCWSPKSDYIAFVSDRSGTPQLWIMPAHGGEARQATRLRGGVSALVWSPDGASVAVLSSPEDLTNPFLEDKDKADSNHVITHVTRLQYRRDGGQPNPSRVHCFIIDVIDWLSGGDIPVPHAVTSGDFSHTEIAWSPDSKRLAMISDRTEQRDANMTTDVWVLTIASGELVCLTNQLWITEKPSWSPDGKYLAWYATVATLTNSISVQHIHVAELCENGEWSVPMDILGKQDVMVGELINADIGSIASPPAQWSTDGQWLYTTQAAHGTVHLWRYAFDGSAAEQITSGPMQIGCWYLAHDARHVFAIITTPMRLPELVQFCLDSLPCTVPERWLTNVNPWLTEKAITIPELVTYLTTDGWWMDAWVQFPAAASDHANAAIYWPAIVLIHGGPHGFYGPIFSTLRQMFVDAGYAVVYMNPRGSVGYGEFFARACDGDWGGGDYRDIMEGLDAVIARHHIDPNRLAVTGTSYGGYLTNWIISHTNRFKAAVTINSVSNLVSSFGTSDIDSVYGLGDQRGSPWQKMAHYIERSPITHAPNIVTPTRVIGAEEDWRCPIEQSEQMFTAIKLLGRTETDFIRIPRVSHSINRATPKQRVAQRKAIIEWIQRYNPA